MGRLAIALLALALADEPGPVNPSTPTRRPAPRVETGRWGWLTDPRSAVLLTLGAAAVFGGGRRAVRAVQARRAAARLAESDVAPEEILDAARYGREGLMDLFRLLSTAPDAARRDAAGRALAGLWGRDELVAEEEKAIVRRGFSAIWRARRRYPRDLAAAIPIRVEYGVPFLREAPGEVGPRDLAWSHRITGAERASLEEPSPWTPGPGVASFAIEPADFAGPGPHRLVLLARVRTVGFEPGRDADLFAKPGDKPKDPPASTPTDWDLELPHIPFNFELDPNLRVDALLAPLDEARETALTRAVALRPSETAEGTPPRFVPINADLLLRDPPALAVTLPLPCDLAHVVFLEFEGVPGRFPAGEAVVIGTGAGEARTIPLDLRDPVPPGAIERPGEVRLRAILEADPHRGWADPDVRSIWPGSIVTDWATARVVRR
jgi:hypothetical protein